ncbi:hypothetical protein D3C72_1997920 [compost metagenome]
MDEAEKPATVRGNGAVHGLCRVEETSPGQLRRVLVQCHLVERLILIPVHGPLLKITLLQVANGNELLCSCHRETPFSVRDGWKTGAFITIEWQELPYHFLQMNQTNVQALTVAVSQSLDERSRPRSIVVACTYPEGDSSIGS